MYALKVSLSSKREDFVQKVILRKLISVKYRNSAFQFSQTIK